MVEYDCIQKSFFAGVTGTTVVMTHTTSVSNVDNRATDRQTDTQTDTDRQTDTQTHTQISQDPRPTESTVRSM